MIPDSTQLGTNDVDSWRAVPAENNPTGKETGAWLVVGGDYEDEPDVCLEVTAEYPKRVAEFIATAVRHEASRARFAGAAGDIADELQRQRRAGEPVNAGSPYLPDTVRLALLMQHLGEVARQVADSGPFSQAEAGKRLYEELTQVGAATIGWMQALLARDLADEDT